MLDLTIRAPGWSGQAQIEQTQKTCHPLLFAVAHFDCFFLEKSRECTSTQHTHMEKPSTGLNRMWFWPIVSGLSKQELADAEHAVARHLEELIHAWHTHFGS